jgi:hypothetical protein
LGTNVINVEVLLRDEKIGMAEVSNDSTVCPRIGLLPTKYNLFEYHTTLKLY